ncbi:MAG TPA: hypothetical protein VEX86_16940 [Longimicrobium sp.]|nr:hypothetical protein [Longimicrobium sp.]
MPEIGAGLINPFAGTHPVTTDPREVAASVAAGERSWSEFPYYEARFGERGRMFGHSDSAWLALIAEAPQEQVNAEVMWLGSVLSARGMPQYLMERHLEFLHEALCAAVPEKRETYDKLLRASELLRGLRIAQIGEDFCRRVAAEFDERVGPEWNGRFPHMGALLISAAADERMGIGRAVPAIEEWVTDAERFPEHWIDAAREALRVARGGVEVAHG